MSQHHLTDLALQLNFTGEDLYANRNGSLSGAQRVRLRRALLREAILYGAIAEVPIAVLLLSVASGVMRQATDSNLIFLVILLLVASIYPVYIVRRYRATRADSAAGKVEAVTGRVHLQDMGRGSYRLEVGEQYFNVGKKLYHAFQNERDYRIYYTPMLKAIVSAEPLD